MQAPTQSWETSLPRCEEILRSANEFNSKYRDSGDFPWAGHHTGEAGEGEIRLFLFVLVERPVCGIEAHAQ